MSGAEIELYCDGFLSFTGYPKKACTRFRGLGLLMCWRVSSLGPFPFEVWSPVWTMVSMVCKNFRLLVHAKEYGGSGAISLSHTGILITMKGT